VGSGKAKGKKKAGKAEFSCMDLEGGGEGRITAKRMSVLNDRGMY
jgi:hypothetical protein